MSESVEQVSHRPPPPLSGPDVRENLPWGLPGPYRGLPVRAGYLRGDRGVLKVATDGEAVAVWVAEKGARSPATATAYRREAERFLLWAAISRDKSLSELSREDLTAYPRFLADPQPHGDWVMTGRYRRVDPRWRPFRGPMNEGARHYALGVVYSLLTYLVHTGWLTANPMPAPRKAQRHGHEAVMRSLSPGQWQAVAETAAAAPEATPRQQLQKARLLWILTFMKGTACRIHEPGLSTMGDLTLMPVEGHSLMVWRKRGKGGKQSIKPLSSAVLQGLWGFREALGLSPYPAAGETMPIFPSLTRLNRQGQLNTAEVQPLGKNQLYRLLKRLFEAAAMQVEASGDADPARLHDAHMLRQATPHWIRHTALRELADSTGDLRLVQAQGDHADIATSAGYTTPGLKALYAALEMASTSRPA